MQAKEKVRLHVSTPVRENSGELSGEQSEEHPNELLKLGMTSGECLMQNRKHRPSDKRARCRVRRATLACT